MLRDDQKLQIQAWIWTAGKVTFAGVALGMYVLFWMMDERDRMLAAPDLPPAYREMLNQHNF